MAYDPNQHMIRLKGQDYLPVAPRLCWFRDKYPQGTVTTEIIHLDVEKQICVSRARVETGEGGVAEGIGSETAKDFGDYIEKSSTKAIGRALLSLGFGTAFAADELDEGTRIVDAPVARSQPAQTAPAPAAKPEIKAVPKPAPKQELSPLSKLMLRAKETGWITGSSKEELRASWNAKVSDVFGSMPDDETLSQRESIALIHFQVEKHEAEKSGIVVGSPGAGAA